jgi:hypothetical protein
MFVIVHVCTNYIHTYIHLTRPDAVMRVHSGRVPLRRVHHERCIPIAARITQLLRLAGLCGQLRLGNRRALYLPLRLRLSLRTRQHRAVSGGDA